MPKLSGFAPVPIRGPWAPPVIGGQISAVRLVLGDPVGRMMALHQEYGEIVAAADRSPAVVCAFGAERNKEVLSNGALYENDGEFMLKTPPGSALSKFRHILTFQTGATHRRHRRLMMPAFQKSAFDGYAPKIVAVAERVLPTWPINRTVDAAELLRDLVEQIAWACFLGLSEPSAVAGLSAVAREFVALITSPGTVALPVDVRGAPYARLLRVSEDLVAKLRALIEAKRAQPEAGNDALSMMIRARDEDDSAFSDDELIAETAMVFMSGHDTQAKSLSWMMFLLDQHPKVLANLVDEVTGVLRGRSPTLEDLPKLPLVDRVVKESLRVLPSVPALFLRVCQAEAPLGPYTLPQGANVLLSPFITQRDPALYPEPRRFRPERWETIDPTIYQYLPFGAGPRMCVGATFSGYALRLLLPMILQRYRLRLAHGAKISRLVRGQVLGPRYGLPMLLAPQDRQFSRGTGVRGDIHALVDLS